MFQQKYTYLLIATSLISMAVYFVQSAPQQHTETREKNFSYIPDNPVEKISTDIQITLPKKQHSIPQPDVGELAAEENLTGMPSTSNAELLTLARTAATSDNPELQVEAFNALIDLAPDEAARILTKLAQEKKSNPYSEQIAITGMLNLQANKDLLTDNDIKNLYELDSPSVKKLAARLLSDRGDNSLVDRYEESFNLATNSTNPNIRLQNLLELSSLKKFNALPHIKTSLNDVDSSVRLQALNLLGAYGSDKDITAVEPLLNDSNPQVRAQSRIVLNSLWRKNTYETITEEQEFAPPTYPTEIQ